MNETETAAGLAPTPGYRYADLVDDQLFVAGQVPLDSRGGLIGPGDVGAQALQCLSNLATLIESHDFEIRHIRRLAIHVVGQQADLATAWTAVLSWFENAVPPATLLGAAALGYREQLVEVDAVIVRA